MSGAAARRSNHSARRCSNSVFTHGLLAAVSRCIKNEAEGFLGAFSTETPVPESVTSWEATKRSVIVPFRPKVARADTTRHLGHARSQVAHAADVDVAHRVVVSSREDGEEVEVLRGSLHGVVRVLQAAQLHLRFQEAVLLPCRADGGHVLPRVGQWILEPASLSQKVTNAPMSFVKARATVTLCSGTLDCCVRTVG